MVRPPRVKHIFAAKTATVTIVDQRSRILLSFAGLIHLLTLSLLLLLQFVGRLATGMAKDTGFKVLFPLPTMSTCRIMKLH